jgi:hypothetical protein
MLTKTAINHLTQELNLSRNAAWRDFLLWILFLEPCISLIYAWNNQQMQQLFIQLINYVWELLHVSAIHCHLQGAFLMPSERCSIEEQSVEYCGWACCVCTHHVTRNNTSIYKILSTAPQLGISRNPRGTLPEDGNVMPKFVGATIHNS